MGRDILIWDFTFYFCIRIGIMKKTKKKTSVIAGTQGKQKQGQMTSFNPFASLAVKAIKQQIGEYVEMVRPV